MDEDFIVFEPKKQIPELKTQGLFWVGVVILIGFLFCFFCTAGFRFLNQLYVTLPSVNQMQNIEQALVSKVYDVNSSPLSEFHIERRFWVPLEKIPPALESAVIAIEDRRFYDHWGVDLIRIFGAAVVDLVRGHIAQGASTLTQQLARNVYLTSKQTIIRKLREILTAVQLESCYTKEEIVELYLNQVYLGAGVYGVEAAAQYYFSKHVQDLTLDECALIAGMIQLPEKYRPDKPANIERITNRRNTVLRAMKSMRVIQNEDYRNAIAIPVKANIQIQRSGIGSYFVEMVRKYVADKYGDDMLYNGGLQIYTTLDPVAQDSAEHALSEQVASLQRRLNRIFLDSTDIDKQLKIPREKFLKSFDSLYALREKEYVQLPDSIKLRQAQMAAVALDVSTAAIRVLIGGRNFEESKFNRVMSARRQPGSSFKPFVYTAALENGYTPASVVLDQPITLMTDEGEWRPENYDRVFNGPISIRSALAKSVNLVAIQVLNKVGPAVVIDYARRMGLKHSMNPVPSLAIGACEATPIEMVNAYQIFANHGVMVKPYFIEKIVDKNGRILETHQAEEKEVLSARTSFLMCSLMRSVVCCGTAASIPGLGFSRPAAGKTGTTNDYSDAWFIGFTPQIVCGVWAGVDERRSLGAGVTGSICAIPVWVKTMQPLHKKLPVKDFEAPEGIKAAMMCKESHKVALPSCPKAEAEFFFAETELDTCDIHDSRSGRKPSNMIKLFSGQQSTAPKKTTGTKKKRPLMF
ncbi:MAG TPA: PBP1A family penicillin-binding protein [Chitinispirillaceae bacterium]|nr:PBP1A family penicillin-binding protein [Chitinispirillaceae bacterium]